MPYSDPDKEREAAKLRKQRQRMSRPDVTPENVTPYVNPDVTPGHYAKIYPDMSPGQIAIEEGEWRKVNERGHLTPEELEIILPWGIDTKRIRVRDDVVAEYNLTQPEPRYGPQKLTKVEVRDKINTELKAKKIDTSVMFLCGQASGQIYDYSKDWYR